MTGFAQLVSQVFFNKAGTSTAVSDTAPLPVKDKFSTLETTTDQAGTNGVLSFTVSGSGDFLMVDVDNTSASDYTTYRCRATVDGSNPTASQGIVCRSGQTTYIPFPTTGTTVKVYALSGTIVAVQLGHY
jgi:hypothetical protein